MGVVHVLAVGPEPVAGPEDDPASPPVIDDCCLLRLNPRIGAEKPFHGYLEPAAAGLLLRPPETDPAVVGLATTLLLSTEGDGHSPPPPGVDSDDDDVRPSPSTALPLRSLPPIIGSVGLPPGSG